MVIKTCINFTWKLVLGMVLLMELSCQNKKVTDTDGRTPERTIGIDSILSYNIERVKDEMCDEWSVPSRDRLREVFQAMKEISGTEWHDCYGDWSCGARGEVIVDGVKCLFRLDAAGFVILRCGPEQRYFGCDDNDRCWKQFPSEFLCGPEGLDSVYN